MASSADAPERRRSAMAKSIMRMAFFFTMPMSRMTPMSEMMEKSVPVSKSARIAPPPAEGNVEMIVSGWIRLS